MDYYMADSPGRLRIESPVLKHNPDKCASFQAYVKGISGVTSVATKVDLGSATILYDPKVIDHAKLIGLIEKTGDFDHFHAKTTDDVLQESLEGAVKVAVDVASGAID